MQLNTLKRKTPNKTHKTVGRGGKRGKTSGRGTKGQKARAGHRIRPEVRDMIKKLPKLRGRGKNANVSIKKPSVVINVSVLDRIFATGASVSVAELIKLKAIRAPRGTRPTVKILGDGELTKKLSVVGCLVSAEAKRKIEAAGGSVAVK
jgi:large subunit ribosomal protein L15